MRSKSVLSGSRVNAPDTRIAEIAARQHGLVRTSDLRAVGLDTSAVSKRHARGRLHRVYRGVYAVGHTALSTEARWLAAVFAAGAGAALCGLAAAELWGLRRAKGAIAVVAPRQVRVRGCACTAATAGPARRHHAQRDSCDDRGPHDRGPRRDPHRGAARERDVRGRLSRVARPGSGRGGRRAAHRPARPRHPRGGDRRPSQGQCRNQEREGGRVPRARPRPHAEADRQREGAGPRGGRLLAGVQLIAEIDGPGHARPRARGGTPGATASCVPPGTSSCASPTSTSSSGRTRCSSRFWRRVDDQPRAEPARRPLGSSTSSVGPGSAPSSAAATPTSRTARPRGRERHDPVARCGR